MSIINIIKMLQQNQFLNITNLFYGGQYSEGLRQISEALKYETNNSNLYVNRALFLSQLGNNQQAIRDIEKAIELNPRNYIAYFNLFSILTKIVEDEEAFSNLCCSLSCLYLIRGKLTKELQDADNSIRYSYNNYEAHVLKGLILMQRQQYAQSLKSFQNALSIDPSNEIIKNLRRVAAFKGHIDHQIPVQSGHIQNRIDYRLKCSYKIVDGVDIFDEIDSKLVQFNKLYVDINDNAGAITQKVPKQPILSPEEGHEVKNGNEQIKIIYDSGLSTPQRQSQIHPEPGNVYIKSSILHEQKREFYECTNQNANFEDQNFMSIINNEQKQGKVEENIVNIASNIVQDEFSSVLNIQHPLEPFQSVISQQKNVDLPLEQKIEEFVESEPTEHYNLIYPIDDHMKLKITILNLQFILKEEESLSRLTDIYCILNYNNGKNKLKTACMSCEDGICSWNQEFEPIDISKTPSDMKIKVYNKQYKSFRDEFLGDLEVLITTADLLKLPLYNKQGILGNLLMHLQLVEVVPVPVQVEPSNEDQESL